MLKLDAELVFLKLVQCHPVDLLHQEVDMDLGMLAVRIIGCKMGGSLDFTLESCIEFWKVIRWRSHIL